MYNRRDERKASIDSRQTKLSKSLPKPSSISKTPKPSSISKTPLSSKLTCTDAVKTDIFGISTPQSTKYTPPKFVPQKKKETLQLNKTRKRSTPPAATDLAKKRTRLEDEPRPAKKDDSPVKQCPYCHKTLYDPTMTSPSSPPTLPPALKLALDEIEAADTEYSKQQTVNPMLPMRRHVSNMDQFRFCQLHRLELEVKPEGIKHGYPIDLDFIDLESRVQALLPALKQIIQGKKTSTYRDLALEAYKGMGMNKARSTLGVMSRFEETLPGYYGPRGASIIMNTLNRRLMLTGFLTIEKTRPQLPLEYLQQVLVPETGWRLIQDDLIHKRVGAGEDRGDDTQKAAMQLMMDTVQFGSKMYPSNDEADDILLHTNDDDNDHSDKDNHSDKDDSDNDDDDRNSGSSDPAEILEYISSDDNDD